MRSNYVEELEQTPFEPVSLSETKKVQGSQLEQLRQGQKMEAVGQLACGIAHDFNNLLTAILGNLSLIQNALTANDSLRPLVEATERAAWRAANLSRQLLGFSRPSSPRPEPLDANRVIAEVMGLLQRSIDPRITLQVLSSADLWLVLADPNQMSQVLMNLCLNARDAVQSTLDPNGHPSKGESPGERSPLRVARIALETANVVFSHEGERQNRAGRPGEFVRLSVCDNGTGISPENQAHIFKPFFTTKAAGKGTGLGLAMVSCIVGQHDGWIECHSALGQGTRFDIFLPRYRPPVAPSSELASSRRPNGGKETVLVVDDEALVRNLGRRILEGFGYHVVVAEDGAQALEVYQRGQQQIDLVLLDLTMPRLSGRETMRRLLKINPSVGVLYSSGYSPEHLTAEDHEQIRGFVSKPYRPDDLARAVRAALDKAAARPEAVQI